MNRPNGVRLSIGLLAAAGAFLLALVLPRGEVPYWYSVVPPILAVTLALITRRVLLSLGGAVLVGGLLVHVPDSPADPATWGEGVRQTGLFLLDVFVERDEASGAVVGPDWGRFQIYAFVVAMLSAVMVMVASGGLQAVIDRFIGLARTARSTQLVTAFTGLLVFIDDYANTMIVGNAMRPLTDEKKVSREKLAFLVDATSAPVAGVALLSTWIGFEVGLFDKQSQAFKLGVPAYEMFLNSLPFYFYCFLMLTFVFVNAFSGKEYGPMLAAERRARFGAGPAEGHPLGAGGPEPVARSYAASAVIPMGVLIGSMLVGLWVTGGGGEIWADQGVAALFGLGNWREVMGEADLNLVLAAAALIGLVTASAFALGLSKVPAAGVARAVGAGLRGSLLPLGILALAGALQNVCDEGGLGTGKFLGELIANEVEPWAFPALVFVVAGFTALATGTSWGTMGILIPIVFPIAYYIDGGYGLITMISLAAVLDGSIFGDHCSPISDTTIMSSTAAGCDHIEHVRTQMPYSATVAVLALGCGYVPAALGVSSWFGVGVGVVLIAALFLLLPTRVERSGVNRA